MLKFNICSLFCSVVMVMTNASASLITTSVNGNLMFEFLSSHSGGGRIEFGIGTPLSTSLISERDFIFVLTGGSSTASPNNVVNMGYVNSGTNLDFYTSSNYGGTTLWAYSSNLDGAPTQRDLVSFRDVDNSLGLGGSVLKSIGLDSWIFYLDDAYSYRYDDDDNDLIIKAWIDPVTSNVVPSVVPEPASISLLTIGGTIGILLRKKLRP